MLSAHLVSVIRCRPTYQTERLMHCTSVVPVLGWAVCVRWYRHWSYVVFNTKVTLMCDQTESFNSNVQNELKFNYFLVLWPVTKFQPFKMKWRRKCYLATEYVIVACSHWAYEFLQCRWSFSSLKTLESSLFNKCYLCPVFIQLPLCILHKTTSDDGIVIQFRG